MKRCLINVYVQPGAKKSELSGSHDDRIKIRLKAPPVEGEANKALIDFLAEQFGLRKQDIQLIRGEKSRFKTISLLAAPEVMEKLMALGVKVE